MKNKINIYIEILAALLLSISKYFLVIWSAEWWILSSFWYIVSFIYLFFLLKLPISSVLQLWLLLLNLYWFYKRTVWFSWLLLIDYVVIFITVIIALFIAYFEIKKHKKLRIYEIVAIISWMLWFIYLAFQNNIWRLLIIFNLIIFNYIFLKKRSYIFVITQTLAIIVIIYFLLKNVI